MIITGLLTAVGIYIVMYRIGIKKFCGYLAATDATLMLVLFVVFFGTFSGMITGLIAGIFLSAMLTGSKRIFGSQKIVRSGKFIAWRDQV